MPLTWDIIEALESAMNEEHKRDREALEWLKRRLSGSAGPSPVRSAAVSVAAPTSENEAGLSLVERVTKIINADPTRTWDSPRMLQYLQTQGVELKAKRPLSTLNRIFRKLHERKVVRRVGQANSIGGTKRFRANVSASAAEPPQMTETEQVAIQ